MRELEASRTSLGAPVILTTNEERDVWTRAWWSADAPKHMPI